MNGEHTTDWHKTRFETVKIASSLSNKIIIFKYYLLFSFSSFFLKSGPGFRVYSHIYDVLYTYSTAWFFLMIRGNIRCFSHLFDSLLNWIWMSMLLFNEFGIHCRIILDHELFPWLTSCIFNFPSGYQYDKMTSIKKTESNKDVLRGDMWQLVYW